MIIIHKGWGLLAIVIPVVFFCMGIYVPKFNNPDIDAHLLDAVIFASALAVWLVGSKLNGNNQEVTVINSGRDQEVTPILKNQHTLYWIPMQWYALVWAAIGALFVYL